MCFSLPFLKIESLAALSDYSVLLGDLVCSLLPRFLLPTTETHGLQNPESSTGVFCHLLEAPSFGPAGPFYMCRKLLSDRKWQGILYVPDQHEYLELECVGRLGSLMSCVTSDK